MAISIPEVKDILKTGIQFGHSASRWNPQMSEFIFGEKNGVHIIDVVQTRKKLEEAAKFLNSTAEQGEVMFVGTKRQAADIVQTQAERAGAHFVVQRWPGGMFTNFDEVRKSLYKLNKLENQFEEGIEGRTKYEVTQMKSEWERLDRLYRGVKRMDNLPKAMVVIDPRYERVAVREAKLLNIPIVALLDSNCDPQGIDYPIPGNDDALKAIEMIMTTLAEAVLAGNEGKGVKHFLKDYTDVEVELKKMQAQAEADREAVEVEEAKPAEPQKIKIKAAQQQAAKSKPTRKGEQKGMLQKKREQAAKSKPKGKLKDEK